MMAESERILLYDGEAAPDYEAPTEEEGRFEDIGVVDSDLEGISHEEKREVAMKAAKAMVAKYVTNKHLPPEGSIGIQVHATDTAEEILAQVQKAKNLAETGKVDAFIATLEEGTGNQKSDVLAGLMDQLNATDSTELQQRVSEIVFTNEEYTKVTRYRDAFKMIRINKMIKNLNDRLNKSAAEAMKYMVGLSTNFFNRGLKKRSFGRKDKLLFGGTQERVEARIESVQETVDDMKKIFAPFKSQFTLFSKVGNEYLKEVKIAGEVA